jgi:hypothetical protein
MLNTAHVTAAAANRVPMAALFAVDLARLATRVRG